MPYYITKQIKLDAIFSPRTILLIRYRISVTQRKCEWQQQWLSAGNAQAQQNQAEMKTVAAVCRATAKKRTQTAGVSRSCT